VCAGTTALPSALPGVPIARSGVAEEVARLSMRRASRARNGSSPTGRSTGGTVPDVPESDFPADSRYKSLYYRPPCQTADELGFLHCHCTYKIVVLFLLSHVGSHPFR
jgi:hypothetical protein